MMITFKPYKIGKLHQQDSANISHDRICNTAWHANHIASKASQGKWPTYIILWLGPYGPEIAYTNISLAITLIDADHLRIIDVL